MRQMNFYLIRLAKSSPGEILHRIRELIFIKKLKIAPGWYLIKLKEDFQKTFYTSTGIKLPETDNQTDKAKFKKILNGHKFTHNLPFVILSIFFTDSPIAINCIHIESNFSIPHGESVKSSTLFIGSKRYKIISNESFI